MAILANKNWWEKCVNLDKTKIATKVQKSWKWHEWLPSCWNKVSFHKNFLYCLDIDRNYQQVVEIKPVYARIVYIAYIYCWDIGVVQHWCRVLSLKFGGKSKKLAVIYHQHHSLLESMDGIYGSLGGLKYRAPSLVDLLFNSRAANAGDGTKCGRQSNLSE